MKTIFKIGILTVLVISALAFTSFAYANSSGPGVHEPGDGALHDYIQEAWAEVLDMSIEDIQALLDTGMTHYDIALAEGVVETKEEFFDLLKTVMTIAAEAAVEDGFLTPEQTQVILQHMNRMGEAGMLGRTNQFGEMKLRGQGTPFGSLTHQTGLMEAFLGLTREQFQARVRNGETLENILAGEGKTMEEWAAFTLQAQTNRLNEAVQSGELTREQADAMILRMQERFETGWLEPIGPMGPFGEPGTGRKLGTPGQHGPGGMDGPYGVPGEGGPSWGSPGMHGPGGHRNPNDAPPGLDNGNGGG